MPRILPATLLALACLAATAPAADPPRAKPKVNFQDHVSAIFQARCNGCHNADKAKGGLTLETYTTTMQGGGSGKVVEPGDPDGSHLFGVVTHAEEPKMPPNGPKIPESELAILKQWLEPGPPENSGR